MQDQIDPAISPIYHPTLFQSFFQGGFASSTEVRGDGRRLDLIQSSGHEMLAAKDYAQLAEQNITTVRDGLRWHQIESAPGEYDWSGFLPMLHAAQTRKMQVIWDLCHYGWPDHLDIWLPEFVERFARFAGAVATKVRDEGIINPWYIPINAISYLAWAGGDMAHIQPMATQKGKELKQQLIRATLAAMDAIRAVDGSARFVQPEPVVHINALDEEPDQNAEIDALRMAQYEVWDMLSGKLNPELGGNPGYLDIIGIIYRPSHQWFHQGEMTAIDDSRYRPFATILQEVNQRFRRPILIAETGAEQDMRAPWLRYVFEQTILAMKSSVAVEGICLYPVADYRNWSGDKHLAFGLLGMPDVNGCRSLFEPVALELRSQQIRLKVMLENNQPDQHAMPA
jgi:hypothetical protein